MNNEVITVAFELCYDYRCLAGKLPIVNSTRRGYCVATTIILDLEFPFNSDKVSEIPCKITADYSPDDSWIDYSAGRYCLPCQETERHTFKP